MRQPRFAIVQAEPYLHELEVLTREFCDNFAAALRKEWGTRLQPGQIEAWIVGNIYMEPCQRIPQQDVSKRFVEFRQLTPRERSENRRFELLQKYVFKGKPPKKTFAKEMALQNARMIKDGEKRSRLIGSGTTDPDLMYDYLKKTLRQKKWRDLVELFSERAERLGKEGGKVFRNYPMG
jgi:hypothetical protein